MTVDEVRELPAEVESETRAALTARRRLVELYELLEDALTAFDCIVVREITAPTHTIFIGRVVAVLGKSGGSPLIFHESRFTGTETD